MAENDLLSSGKHQDDGSVAFDYVKSSDFRTVWADGAVGGATPSGLIHFAIYSERPAIPRRQVFSVEGTSAEGSRLGPELVERRVSRDAIVREMPVDVLVSPAVAESLARWLLEQVELIRSSTKV